MTFLRNSWYVAAWNEALAPGPQQIKILGETLALYRNAEGTAVAVGGICPHRFASLASGTLVDDALQCPYHGLRFDQSGRCVHNPHAPESRGPDIRIAAYPVIERHRAIWVWMGDPPRADPALIPDLSALDAEDFECSRDYLAVKANYQLVTDNLLDLSHVAYLHPFLTTPGFAERSEHEVKQEGRNIWSNMRNADEEVTPIFALLWDGKEKRGRFRSLMRWTVPSNLLLDVGMEYHDAPGSDGPTLISAHLLTPETESTTHYFWTIGRNRRQGDAELTRTIHEGIDQAFTREDEPMIAEVAQNMAGRDFWSMRPVILPTDRAAVRARRLLAKLMTDEAWG